jgi:serine/threonine-protein kinase
MCPPRFPARFGSYVLVQSLGRGGMGQVALAISGQPGLETLCVIKRPLPPSETRPEHVARFRQEANIARRLSHPNLVQTHAVGEAEGSLFLAQEFVEGKDLSQLIASCASSGIILSIQISLYIIEQVARGLAYAHDFEGLGLVHRDVNPPNIRLSYGGHVKVLDFGVALSADATRSDPDGTMAGKLGYAAPEQIRRGPLDRRADLYACGIMLWELLTGRPFGTTVRDGEAVLPGDQPKGSPARKRLEIIPPSLLNPAVPAALDEIALKAVRRDPAERYQTAGELRKTIEPLISSEAEAEQTLVKLLGDLYLIENERAYQRENIEAGRPLLSPSESVSAAVVVEQTSPALTTSGRSSRSPRMLLALVAVLGLVGMGAVALRVRHQSEKVTIPPAPVAAAPGAKSSAGQAVEPTWPEPAQVPAVPSSNAEAKHLSGREVPRSKSGARPAAPVPHATAEPPSAATPSVAELLGRAQSAMNRKEYDAAIQNAQAAIQAGGGPPGHVALGNALLLDRRLPEAQREFETVLRADPGNKVAAQRLVLLRGMHARGEY